MVFLLISCAFTVVNLWDHFYHFVIWSSTPPHPTQPLHGSVLYRNITLVRVTVHPEVRNLSSPPECDVPYPSLCSDYFCGLIFPSVGNYEAMSEIPGCGWFHLGIVLWNIEEFNSITLGEGWLMFSKAILPNVGVSVSTSFHQNAQEITAL